MELTCAVVLLIVGFVTASPYGYGTKGGAVAKADASAVSGAYTGVGDTPISIPKGAGFSGSFSKSYSSSAASSSSSSSSSSFSYSGSGVIGGISGCGSGNCKGGETACGAGNCNGGATGSGGAGSQAVSKASAGSVAGAYGSGTGGSDGHKYGGTLQTNKGQDCGSEGCNGIDSDSLSSTGTGLQSASDAKAAASAGPGLLKGSRCEGSDCNPKCTSGNCGTDSDKDAPLSQYESSKKCTSGQCSQDKEAGSTIYFGSDDIYVASPGTTNPKSSYDTVGSGCSNGKCDASSTVAPLLHHKPSIELTAPKLDNPLCTGDNCGSTGNGITKPDYLYGSSNHLVKSSGPGCLPGSPGCGTTPSVSGLSDCTTGNCGAYPAVPGYGSSSFKPSYSPSNSPSHSLLKPSLSYAGGTGTSPGAYQTEDDKSPAYTGGFGGPAGILNPACAPGTPGCSVTKPLSHPSGCASGNCDSKPSAPGYGGSSNIKPSFSHGSSPSYSPVKPSVPVCTPGTPGCGMIPSISGPSDCASGNCGSSPPLSGYGSSSSIKPSYSSGGYGEVAAQKPESDKPPVYNGGFGGPAGILSPDCAPGTPGCSVTKPLSHPSGCASGNCDSNPSTPGYGGSSNIKPSYSQGSSPSYNPVKPSIPVCTPGAPGCGTTVSGPSNCASGNCGSSPVLPGYGGSSSVKPGYFSGSYGAMTGANAQKPDSDNPPVYSGGFDGPAGILSPGCAPGTPGCGVTKPFSHPSLCASGNCDSNPSTPGYGGSSNIKPSYSHGSSPSYNPVNPSIPVCTPGAPGCGTTSSLSGPSNCASGNCGSSPLLPGYGGISSIKPSFSSGSFGTATGANAQKPESDKPPVYSGGFGGPDGILISACTPGSSGCSATTSSNNPSVCASGNCVSNPHAPEYGTSSSIKPSYSHSSSSSYSPSKPSVPVCIPGAPGCGSTSSGSGPIDCASGNCGSYPSSPGYGGPSSVKPSYSSGSSYSHSSVKPSSSYTGGLGAVPGANAYKNENYKPPAYSSGFGGPAGILNTACAPGTPGCSASTSLNHPSGCTSGNCGSNPSAPGYDDTSNSNPSYTQSSSPSSSAVKPLGPACAPGTPGCGITLSGGGSSSITTGYSLGSSLSYAPVNPSVSGCAPGTLGCGSPPAPGSFNIKPGYTHDSSLPYSPNNPSGSGCAPGVVGCGTAPSVPGHGNFPKIKPNYSEGSSLSKCGPGIPGCSDTPSSPGYVSISTSKPSSSYGSSSSFSSLNPSGSACEPGSPGCPTVSSDCASGNCGTYTSSKNCSPGSTGCSGTSSTTITGPYGSTSHNTGSSLGHGASGIGSSSNHGSFGSHTTGQISYNKPSTGFPNGSSGSETHKPGATGYADHDQKEKLPAYTGGFGGPAGILNPNEFTVPSSPYGSKPTILSGLATGKPACSSGNCDKTTYTSPSHAHSGSTAGAQASATANADAVPYTAGFAGPPGFLKPYDSGKVDLKETAGNKLLGSPSNLHQSGSGSGHLTHTNGGSLIGGSAIAQSSATAIGTSGVSGTSGCEGGCGGSGGAFSGYSKGLALSQASGVDGFSNGLATAGSVAKSVASASSGARAFGSSYSSSSASAHASAGVKGGYGRR